MSELWVSPGLHLGISKDQTDGYINEAIKSAPWLSKVQAGPFKVKRTTC